MAKNLSKSGITTGNTVKAGHVTQSIDAFTGTEAYDIVLSGSLIMTGSITGQSGITNNLTSSYTITASHALNAGAGTSTFPFTGDAIITGSLTVSGSNTFTNIGPFSQTGVSTFSGSIQAPDQTLHLSASNLLIANGFISQSQDTSFGGMSTNRFRANIDLDENQVFNAGGNPVGQFTTSDNTLKIAGTHAVPIEVGRSNLSQITLKGQITASGIISASGVSGGFIGEVTNVYRPITTLSTNPFTASNATAGTYYRAGGNITCSIFSSSLVSCTLGSEFEIIQTSSAGYVLFETGSGVTLNSKSGNLKLAGQFSAVTLKKVGDNEWDLIGDLG